MTWPPDWDEAEDTLDDFEPWLFLIILAMILAVVVSQAWKALS